MIGTKDLFRYLDAILNHSEALCGIPYLKEVSEKLSIVLDFKYVLIGRPVEGNPSVIRTDICVVNGQTVENMEYPLAGTPCNRVITGRRVCIYEKNIAKLFPEDETLKEMGVESYAGAPMLDKNGTLLGLCVIQGTQPISDPEFISIILEFIAGRAALEYSREKSEQRLLNMNKELAEQVTLQTRTLQAEKERLEILNTELEKASQALRDSQQILSETSRLSGIAEMSGFTLHTIGNAINTISIEHEMTAEQLRSLGEIGDILKKLADKFHVLTEDHQQRDKIIQVLNLSAQKCEDLVQLSSQQKMKLDQALRLIKNSLAFQSRYARADRTAESFDITGLCYETGNALSDRLQVNRIEIDYDLERGVTIVAEKHKLFHCLLALINNGIDSISQSGKSDRKIKMQLRGLTEEVQLIIEDTGLGVEPENEVKLFSLGFTTKRQGMGFGLHNTANFINHLGGTIRFTNLGYGVGARVTIHVPRKATSKELAM